MNWGVLYYAFSVLLVPLERELRSPRWLVAGAFSAGLLVSAAAAPLSGRLADRGYGPAMLQAGGFAAAFLLIAWSVVPALWMTYLVWTGLGVCMAAILYEPVFAIVGRAFGDARSRLRAIATVTVMGGLASTAFLPATSWLTGAFGWRGAVLALAIVLAASTVVVSCVAFGALSWSPAELNEAIFARARHPLVERPRGLTQLSLTFAFSSMVNSAVASNIVAALIDRRLSPATAATIGGLFGVMQLPGRVLMTNPAFSPGPVAFVMASFALQIGGLLILMGDGTFATIAGVTVFACGAGLTTLARPYMVLHMFGAAHAGAINGTIARAQQLARAVGPVSAAALAGVIGYGKVFAALAALLVAAIAVTPIRRWS